MAESKAESAKKDDAEEVVAAQDAEPGYRGVQADETPNENYTVAGVVAGKPTPETEQK